MIDRSNVVRGGISEVFPTFRLTRGTAGRAKPLQRHWSAANLQLSPVQTQPPGRRSLQAQGDRIESLVAEFASWVSAFGANQALGKSTDVVRVQRGAGRSYRACCRAVLFGLEGPVPVLAR
jgi:hypothetical protein